MRFVVLISAVLFSAFASAESESDDLEAARSVAAAEFPELDWNNDIILVSDVDNDSDRDFLLVGLGEGSFSVAIVRRSDGGLDSSSMSFSISRTFQLAACGVPRAWRKFSRSEAPLNALGAYPPGYDDCLECQEFMLADDGGCDPIFIFWNTISDQIDWWRA